MQPAASSAADTASLTQLLEESMEKNQEGGDLSRWYDDTPSDLVSTSNSQPRQQTEPVAPEAVADEWEEAITRDLQWLERVGFCE